MASAKLEKPKSKAKTTKAPVVGPDSWSRIDARCKPSKVLSRDKMRPALNYGYIRHEPEHGSFLFATNAYILVALPITMDPDIPEADRPKVLPEVGIPLDGLRLLDKSTSGEFRIVNGLFEASGDPALYRVGDSPGQPPNFRELLKDAPVKGGHSVVEAIGINPVLLQALSSAMGASPSGVALRFKKALGQIRVEALNHSGAEGVLMPIRIDL